ncbi:MAG: ParB/RepB/Spo0J family partition protein [Rhodoferax sp.]
MSTQSTTTDEFKFLPLSVVVASLTNPRKSFNPAKLAELAESIKASGVHQPILVRPLPGARVGDTDRSAAYEIVAGERRYRASQLAGLASIPALVRPLGDHQVLEIQLVENLQRDDLTELEEAEGYDSLMQASGLSAEAVGGKIGKSRSYVYGRLKLLDLSSECKQALRDGQIDASRAILIARIPDTALQTKALAEATRKDFAGQVCSVRAFNSWLLANVMLRLDRAMFHPSDSALLIGVGNCTTCPKRTGANPDLFADVQGADICTDPVCFHEKEEAHRNSVLDTAAKRGMRLIDGDEAGEICSQYNDFLDGYSPLSQERNDTADGQSASLGQLLGKDLGAPVLIENPWTKELIAAVPTEEAEAMLLARGLVKAVQAKQKPAGDIEGDIKRLQASARKATTKLFRDMAFKELASTVHGCSDAMALTLINPRLLRAWWLRQVEEMNNSDLAKMFDLTLLKPEVKTTGERQDAQTTQMRLHVQACAQGKLYKALALHLVLDDNPDYFYGDIEEATLLTALASEIGVDLDDIEAQATAQVRDETAEELNKLKAQLKGQAVIYRGPNGETWSGRGLKPRWLTAYIEAGGNQDDLKTTLDTVKPAKPLLPLASAAQAKGGGGAKGQKSERPAAPASVAPLRKRKLSAQEAQAAIATAMQGQDTEPGADAQGIDADSSPPVAPAVADAPSTALAVGTRVRVTADDELLPQVLRKWAGKGGVVNGDAPVGAGGAGCNYIVTFRGRNGGSASFISAQLEVVPA